MPPKAPRAANPSREIFDPFNSSATGHQRAENRLSGSTLWRDSRHNKLRDQFRSGAGGGKRIADSVGAGSDGSVKMGLLENGTVTWKRERDQLSLYESLTVGKSGGERASKRLKLDAADRVIPDCVVAGEHVVTPAARKDGAIPVDLSPSDYLSPIDPNTASPSSSQERSAASVTTQTTNPSDDNIPTTSNAKQIFANLTIYINGTTAPRISDHKLKRLLAEHGACVSIALGRRTVTHVILSRPGSAGGGGGLSGTKIQKEIAMRRGESVKYVTVEWVLESVRAGKRLPETRFEALRLAPKGVGSVRDLFARKGKGG